MANFFDNFNFDPVSTEVKTVSYTIPTGTYARVRVTGFLDDFKIDGSVALDLNAISGSSGSIVATGSGSLFDNTTASTLSGSGTISGTLTSGSISVFSSRPNIYTDSIMTVTKTTSSTATFSGIIPVGASLDFNSVSPSHGQIVSWNFKPAQAPDGFAFWVPEGSLIEGTKFVVELYNKQGN